MQPKSLSSIFRLISWLDSQAHWTAHKPPALPSPCCQVPWDCFFLLCIHHQRLSRVTRPSPAEACGPHSSGDYIHPQQERGKRCRPKGLASSEEGGAGGRERKELCCTEHQDEHRQEPEDSTAGKGDGKQSYTITILHKIGQQGI